MKRRSTRAEVLLAEGAQAEIIGLLVSRGETLAANRLAACQAARIWRSADVHRYRCRSPGCVACWDGSLAGWWLGFRKWCQEDGNTFAVTLPADERFAAPVARALRDLRDRHARSDPAWAEMTLLGITDGSTAYVLVSPWYVAPDEARAALRGRWPTLAPIDEGQQAPAVVTAHIRALLATKRRGSAPLRFTIFPKAQPDQPVEALEPPPFFIVSRLSPLAVL